MVGSMAAANYYRPKPIDPLWYRQDCEMVITCVCGRLEKHRVRNFQARHSLPDEMRFYEIVARLRCTTCGAKPDLDVRR